MLPTSPTLNQVDDCHTPGRGAHNTWRQNGASRCLILRLLCRQPGLAVIWSLACPVRQPAAASCGLRALDRASGRPGGPCRRRDCSIGIWNMRSTSSRCSRLSSTFDRCQIAGGEPQTVVNGGQQLPLQVPQLRLWGASSMHQGSALSADTTHIIIPILHSQHHCCQHGQMHRRLGQWCQPAVNGSLRLLDAVKIQQGNNRTFLRGISWNGHTKEFPERHFRGFRPFKHSVTTACHMRAVRIHEIQCDCCCVKKRDFWSIGRSIQPR
mmetsp:Transcript_42848/g.97687  ORF Transcript_42848/g.97687 Transcript_42848/m.97687 type:complete len:267 (+) Transcript_42848:1-801(+)